MLTLWRYGVFVLDRSLVLVLPVILGFSSSSPDNKMWQQAPLDTVFMLNDVDDMLESWESLFNSVLDEHCPWREKGVKRLQQVPWMSKPIYSCKGFSFLR